ncbi:hypothetical protein [Pseudomonas schmalbachii]|uniref:GspL cytoplasmic actin-ATPase-like domain-containing protein n=1 Tax=Pseudomonas schmalbachii TaxID=2816993 RepID=A0ABS3TLP0_9PSED|nr:hypothetical protein [Pseudomonas schmalbachii]MBO3274594.1 hypothetical protein [Pseudomonas schmalbachii]
MSLIQRFHRKSTQLLAFSPPRLWQVRGDDGASVLEWSERPQGLWRKVVAQWVLDRSLCVYRCVDLTHVPRAQRAQALEIKLASLAPFRQSGTYVAWRGGVALLWMWDEQERLQSAAVLDDVPRNYRCIPETLLQQPASTGEPAGVRIVAVRRGVDLQVWRSGVLLMSVFFPALPSSARIAALLRGIGGLEALDPRTLAVESLPTLASVWAAPVGTRRHAEWERWVPHGLAAALILGCAFELAQGLSWSWDARDLKSREAELGAQVEPLLAARNRALQASSEAASLQALRQAHSSQGELLRRLSALLPEDSQLLSWRYKANDLELLIDTQRVDPRFFVQRLQDEGKFHNVRVEPSPRGDGVQLTMSLM